MPELLPRDNGPIVSIFLRRRARAAYTEEEHTLPRNNWRRLREAFSLADVILPRSNRPGIPYLLQIQFVGLPGNSSVKLLYSWYWKLPCIYCQIVITECIVKTRGVIGVEKKSLKVTRIRRLLAPKLTKMILWNKFWKYRPKPTIYELFVNFKTIHDGHGQN